VGLSGPLISLSDGFFPQFSFLCVQVDDVGNAWVAGCTWTSFLDGEPRAYDLFLMKFDVQGVHQWTSQRGGQGWDEAQALQADWGATSFSNLFHGGTALDSLARSMF